MTNVMLDLETLGKSAGCAILSIGTTVFDPRGDGHGDKFYLNVDRNDCLRHGLTSDPSTVAWWAEQSQAAQDHLLHDQRPLFDSLLIFLQWWGMVGGEKVWCQGATFDAPVMQTAFEAVGLAAPWKFWNVRDTRTVYDIQGFNPYSVQRVGTYHNALDDAIHQVKCVQTAMRKGAQ